MWLFARLTGVSFDHIDFDTWQYVLKYKPGKEQGYFFKLQNFVNMHINQIPIAAYSVPILFCFVF